MKTRTLILTLLTCLCACTSYRDEITELHKEIDSIRNEKISTIDEQVKNIQVSITELETYKTGLDGYIKALQEQDNLLKEAIEAAKSSSKDNDEEISGLEDKVSKSEAAISALETRLASVEGTLTTMQGCYETLDGRIADLKKYVNDELSKVESGVKEWANATFCTLQQYYGVTDDITAINGSIALINTALSDMEKSITALDGKLSAETDSKLASAISNAKAELGTTWKEDIKAASTALETSLKAWVNSQLAGYYTAAEADAKIALAKQELERELASQNEALESQIDELKELLGGGSGSGDPETIAELRSKISELQQKLEELTESYAADIEKLQSDLATAKQEITEAYQAAIQTAITENNGHIDNKIVSAISEANAALSAQITEISSQLETLVVRVDALETQVSGIRSELNGMLSDMSSMKKSLGEILSMIQSITVVPENSDGSVNVSLSDSETVDFEIFPLFATKALVENWSGSVSLRAVYTEPVTKSSHNFVDLPVSDVTYVDGVVTVTYNSTGLSENFWDEIETVNARLLISDGNNCVSSQYYLLKPQAPDKELSSTANCYIVSKRGLYKFPAVKGNSDESVGDVVSASVLWESFGTDEDIVPGDLIAVVSYDDGNIIFETAAPFREGNAVIAAKDASGNILWSWHIWLTDEPQGQEYNNNAGVMMDRNLGATSAAPGDVGALGLIYQWGRKDPFLGSSSIISNTEPESTIIWPSTVVSDSSTGTIDYTISHPTTFIALNSNNTDWLYSGDSSIDYTRWQHFKTIYDPCPAGWRVPEGGYDGVWATASGEDQWRNESDFDFTNYGMDFSVTDKTLGSSVPIWYPASGNRLADSGSLSRVGGRGYYWSIYKRISSSDRQYAPIFELDDGGAVYPADAFGSRALGLSLRCLQE